MTGIENPLIGRRGLVVDGPTSLSVTSTRLYALLFESVNAFDYSSRAIIRRFSGNGFPIGVLRS
jgi:hypothetical protein